MKPLSTDLSLHATAHMRPAEMQRLRLAEVHTTIVSCERCARLRSYCRRVAQEKKRAHRDDTYWGRPVPGFRTANGPPRERPVDGHLGLRVRRAGRHLWKRRAHGGGASGAVTGGAGTFNGARGAHLARHRLAHRAAVDLHFDDDACVRVSPQHVAQRRDCHALVAKWVRPTGDVVRVDAE